MISDRACMPNNACTRLVVVGDPRSKRTVAVQEAAAKAGLETQVYSYEDILAGEISSVSIAERSWIRLESPGVNASVNRLILKAGIEPMERLHRVPLVAAAIDALEFDRGEIVHPHQWFLGLAQILTKIETTLGWQGIRWMNSPAAIITAFDKRECIDRWAKAGLPVADGFSGIKTYAQLRASIPDDHARLMIKLRYGYSAMGTVALEWRGSRVRAITTADVTWSEGRPRIFVSKRPRTLHREFQIAWLIDTLATEEIVVERWLPKVRWCRKPFDLRILTIGGRARHVVGRTINSPFTNLNLDAGRIEGDELAEALASAWPASLQLAEDAARLIGDGYFGMDILVQPNHKCVVLEANAFGDYLPGLLHHGESTYSAELRELCGAGVTV